jgi:hypothetical protein
MGCRQRRRIGTQRDGSGSLQKSTRQNALDAPAKVAFPLQPKVRRRNADRKHAG